jgi:hypothetical protein
MEYLSVQIKIKGRVGIYARSIGKARRQVRRHTPEGEVSEAFLCASTHRFFDWLAAQSGNYVVDVGVLAL